MMVKEFEVHLPPVGYGVSRFDGKTISPVPILGENLKVDQAFWYRDKLPTDYSKLLHTESKRRVTDPTYSDKTLQRIRQEWWHRREYGVWFINEREPTYVTGLHWFFLTCWYMGLPTNGGYPDYRETDRDFFYFLEWVDKNPTCYGTIYVTKRREGKTAKAGVFCAEPATRTKHFNVGIQSKTEEDASRIVYLNGLARPIMRLPDFFLPRQPGVSRSQIARNNLTFAVPPKEHHKYGYGLESTIRYAASGETAFDGDKLQRYIGDEVFKTEHIDVERRHQVHKFCCENNGEVIGKMIYPSTVEEIEGSTEKYISMWEEANWDERDELGFTKNGLVRFYLPADESATVKFTDRYGRVNSTAQRAEILKSRERLESNPAALYAEMRKKSLSIQEAFRFAGQGCAYDAALLNQAYDRLAWSKDNTISGTFKEDKEGIVQFVKSKDGPWKLHPAIFENAFRDSVSLISGQYRIEKRVQNVLGVDPYDNTLVEDLSRASKGACAVVCREHEDDRLDGNIIALYVDRPAVREIFYEQVRLGARYFSGPILVENNKSAIFDYFDRLNCQGLMQWLPGRNVPGVPSSPQTKGQMVEVTEDFIVKKSEKLIHVDLVKDWLAFDPAHTQKYDAAMAAGWALYLADFYDGKHQRKKSRSQTVGQSSSSLFSYFSSGASNLISTKRNYT